MNFNCDNQTITLQPEALIVAGWTGRNIDAVQHHIDELKALGISPPSQVPLFYRVSHSLLTHDDHLSVLGAASSGEVEPLLLNAQDELWLGLASDHTDRDLEAYSVAASKQACAKPCATELWRLADVSAHLDELILSCEIFENEALISYQSSKLANIRPLEELMQAHSLSDNSAMLCGTLGAIGGVRPARNYRMKLHDPIRHKSIRLAYSVSELPIVK